MPWPYTQLPYISETIHDICDSAIDDDGNDGGMTKTLTKQR